MSDFLHRFYECRVMAEKKHVHTDLSGIWRQCKDVVVDDGFLRKELSDTCRRNQNARMLMTFFLILPGVPAAVIAGTYIFKNAFMSSDTDFFRSLFSGRIYYAVSLYIILLLQIPFFRYYEKGSRDTGTAARIASMVALNVTGRAAFFMFSDFKPVYAVTIISGIAFGSLSGFMTGALTMLVSNFLFGQGPWTPWQMFALGLIGFISGLLTEKGLIPQKRISLAIYGFFMAVAVYGGIMNPAAMLMSVARPSLSLLAAYYISGLPVDLIKGAATFVFLWIAAEPLLKKIKRVTR